MKILKLQEVDIFSSNTQFVVIVYVGKKEEIFVDICILSNLGCVQHLQVMLINNM